MVAPSRVAERLNRQFPMDRTRQYFTLVYGVIDQTTGRFQYVLAGHPAPVLLRRGAPPVIVDGVGLPIGMIDEATFEDESLTLEPGDRLYFYTDGATEALDAAGEEFGHARLLEEIVRWRDQPLRAGIDMISATVLAWCGDSLKDDVSLLAVERL
jgi:sigma-B regulation protein RsbU (phosphoserine phosphatase)